MGSVHILVGVLMLQSTVCGMYFEDDDCVKKRFCSPKFDFTNMGIGFTGFTGSDFTFDSGTKISYILPEICHPFSSGLTKMGTVQNRTVNAERECDISNIDKKYRTVDGTCNNPANLGASTKQLSRLLRPRYADSREAPYTRGKNGKPLPNPRLVSRVVHPDVHRSTSFSIWVMQWGQLMDHDVVSTPLPVDDTRRLFKCCTDDRTAIRPDADPECLPIMFGRDKNFIGSCMEFVRSMPIKDRFGKVKLPREHMNVVTAFVDASTVYGSNEERLKEIRDDEGRGYLLKVTEDDYLPSDGGNNCIKRNDNDYCFLAGDERVNEQPGLSVIHTIFVRLHNRIAHMLRYMRPMYPSEEIFQKARSIVIAITQKIMYTDWLPIVLGESVMRTKGIAVGPEFERPEYQSSIDPTIPTDFATAVFRFGHTLIPRSFPMGRNKPLLREQFFKPYAVVGNLDEFVAGLTYGYDEDSRTQNPDPFVVEEVTNHLFENEEGVGRSFDLLALNIQRGRDHGLSAFNDYREYCGLHRVESFDDPALGISGRALAAVYNHPDDIELFPGGMSEPVVHGGLLGATFNCIMSQVFYNLKYGDRFFYETKGQKSSLSEDELAEIRKVTWAQVLCQTSGIREIQLNAFRVPGKENPKVGCDWLVKRGINLGVFVRNW